MHAVSIAAGIVVLLSVLLDAFETVVLPRRVRRQFRITSWFYRNTWVPWARLVSRIKSQTRREAFFGYFGPLSMIGLLILWACGLIFAFALLQYGGGEHLFSGSQKLNFRLLLYHSGETFFTLGYGDITPVSGSSRFLSVAEAGMGFAFLGVVIGYLPTIYSAFSRREIEISLLDARAGSPPSATELLTRAVSSLDQGTLDRLFHDGVDVLDVHDDGGGRGAGVARRRRRRVREGIGEHHDRVADLELGVADLAIRAVHARALFRAERLRVVLDRLGRIVHGEVRDERVVALGHRLH